MALYKYCILLLLLYYIITHTLCLAANRVLFQNYLNRFIINVLFTMYVQRV